MNKGSAIINGNGNHEGKPPATSKKSRENFSTLVQSTPVKPSISDSFYGNYLTSQARLTIISEEQMPLPVPSKSAIRIPYSTPSVVAMGSWKTRLGDDALVHPLQIMQSISQGLYRKIYQKH